MCSAFLYDLNYCSNKQLEMKVERHSYFLLVSHKDFIKVVKLNALEHEIIKMINFQSSTFGRPLVIVGKFSLVNKPLSRILKTGKYRTLLNFNHLEMPSHKCHQQVMNEY